MASYNSDLISKAAAARLKQANGVVDGDDKGGNVLYATTRVVLTGAEAATDTLQLVDLPNGAVIIPQLSHVSNDGTGATALTLHVGDAGDVDRYALGVAAVTAGSAAFSGGVATTAPYRLPALTRVFATVATKTGTITAGKTIVITIAYRVKG